MSGSPILARGKASKANPSSYSYGGHPSSDSFQESLPKTSQCSPTMQRWLKEKAKDEVWNRMEKEQARGNIDPKNQRSDTRHSLWPSLGQDISDRSHKATTSFRSSRDLAVMALPSHKSNLSFQVHCCLEYFMRHNAVHEKRLFYQNGSVQYKAKARERSHAEAAYKLHTGEQESNIHAVASLFKKYLRKWASTDTMHDLRLKSIGALGDLQKCLSL